MGRDTINLWSIDSLELQPLIFAFSMIAGAWIYFAWPEEPLLKQVIAIAIAVILIGLLILRLSSSLFLNLIVIGVIAGFLAFGASALRAKLVEAPRIEFETDPVMIEGWVTQFQPGDKGTRILLRVNAIQGWGREQTPQYVRLTHRLDPKVRPGRFVRCWGVLRPPPTGVFEEDYDFERQAYFQKLGGVGYVQGRCRGGALGAPVKFRSAVATHINAARHQIAQYVSDAAGPEAGGFAAAVVSGDRSFLSTNVQDNLRGSGLAHLLAISGLHMGLLGGVVYFLVFRTVVFIEPLVLRFPAQKIAAAFALSASLAYLILSGASVPTQRAFVMSAVVFSAILLDRSALSYRSYAIAIVIVVLMRPESVVTPGFQMSFAASGALIATYDAWTKRRVLATKPMGRIAYAMSSLTVTSIVATAATAPFALFHFNRVSSLSVLANLFAMPIVSFISAPLATASLVAVPFGLADEVLHWFGRSLEIIQNIAAYFAGHASNVGASWPQMPWASLVWFSAALAAAMILKGVWRWLGYILLNIPAIIVWLMSPTVLVHWSSSGDLFIARGGASDVLRFAVLSGEGLPPLRYANLPTSECDDDPCEIATDWGQVHVSHPMEAHAKVTITFKQQVPIELEWEPLLNPKGQTLSRQNGELYLDNNKCHVRRWHKCPSESYS